MCAKSLCNCAQICLYHTDRTIFDLQAVQTSFWAHRWRTRPEVFNAKKNVWDERTEPEWSIEDFMWFLSRNLDIGGTSPHCYFQNEPMVSNSNLTRLNYEDNQIKERALCTTKKDTEHNRCIKSCFENLKLWQVHYEGNATLEIRRYCCSRYELTLSKNQWAIYMARELRSKFRRPSWKNIWGETLEASN